MSISAKDNQQKIEMSKLGKNTNRNTKLMSILGKDTDINKNEQIRLRYKHKIEITMSDKTTNRN